MIILLYSSSAVCWLAYYLGAHGFLAAQGFFAAQGFSFFCFAADVFFFAAQGFLAAHGFLAAQGLACDFDALGLQGLQGLACVAATAAGAPRAKVSKPAVARDLATDFDCDFMMLPPMGERAVTMGKDESSTGHGTNKDYKSPPRPYQPNRADLLMSKERPGIEPKPYKRPIITAFPVRPWTRDGGNLPLLRRSKRKRAAGASADLKKAPCAYPDAASDMGDMP